MSAGIVVRTISLDRTKFVNKPYEFVFDVDNPNYHTSSPESNSMFLKGVHQHMNNMLQKRGHVFLNEYLDALWIGRVGDGQLVGWHEPTGKTFVDVTVSRRDETYVLSFNVDGIIFDLI